MKIHLGFDHRGRVLAREIEAWLASRGVVTHSFGPDEGESSDYPDAASAVGRSVALGRCDLGILVCGSGIGMSVAANKVAGVRAALATNAAMAEQSRRHNDANILCLGASNQSGEEALRIVEAWLAAAFEGGRHERRIEKIRAIEKGEGS
jgi:ribose 5-phosphate isomerase B